MESARDDVLAWRMTRIGLALEAAALAGIWGSWTLAAGQHVDRRDYRSPIGWTAALAAALIFGFSEVPAKAPESRSGRTLFNASGFVSNGLVHCSLGLALSCRPHGAIQWQWQGATAAFDIMVVQVLGLGFLDIDLDRTKVLARSAVWLLGIAVAPPCWCAIGMATSFAWGTLAFGDRPGLWGWSLLGLFLLVSGVVLVSQASMLSHRTLRPVPKSEDLAETVGSPCPDLDEGNARGGKSIQVAGDTKSLKEAYEESALEPTDPCAKLARGFAYAVGAGLADGSLIAFYQGVEGTPQGDTIARLVGYFSSFGATMTTIGSALSLSVLLRSRVEGSRCAGAVPGLASGAMWAGANSCSVLASHFLGMAVSFPLTQTAVICSGLMGMLVFRELVGTSSRLVFSLALVVTVTGAFLLATFGQPR